MRNNKQRVALYYCFNFMTAQGRAVTAVTSSRALPPRASHNNNSSSNISSSASSSTGHHQQQQQQQSLNRHDSAALLLQQQQQRLSNSGSSARTRFASADDTSAPVRRIDQLLETATFVIATRTAVEVAR
jgi:hypothetical protein